MPKQYGLRSILFLLFASGMALAAFRAMHTAGLMLFAAWILVLFFGREKLRRCSCGAVVMQFNEACPWCDQVRENAAM